MACQHCHLGACQRYAFYFFYLGEYILGHKLTHLGQNLIQSTLVISKLKVPSETLRDIRTSTYQIFRIEENTNRTTKFHK